MINDKITQAEIEKTAVLDELKEDVKMGEDVMVPGTPTIFVNGINDRTRELFQALTK